MESTIVIKVKYGETLRRFNARVDETGHLGLDMGGLREKVLGLFNFAPDVDLTLTYIDEDGDVVALVDEEDLLDVVRQSLNPWRITVKLNSERVGRFNTRSSGNSTPMRSPRVQHLLPNLNSSVSDILKSVPEPLREALSNLSSTAALSSPVIAELVDCFSKMGHSHINTLPEFPAGTQSNPQCGASCSAMDASMTKKVDAFLKDRGTASVMIPNTNFEEPAYVSNQKLDLEKGTRGLEALVTPTSGSLNLNSGLSSDSSLTGCVSADVAPVASRGAVCDSKDHIKKLEECHLNGNTGDMGGVNFKPHSSNFPASDNKEVKKPNDLWKPVVAESADASASFSESVRNSTKDFKDTNLGGLSGIFSEKNVKECPFTGMPLANDSPLPSMHNGSYVPPFKRSCGSYVPPFARSYNNCEGMGSIFHRGVRCDGCGVHPITGPRYKSTVKEDYDLCGGCFSQMGNRTDYIKLDRPVPYLHPHSFKRWQNLMRHPRVLPPTLPNDIRGGGMKPSRPKLNSRFIEDVNVLDGTIMAPSTSFTKIWRMFNNGTIVWPQGTKLVWIGGDKLTDIPSVELQISSDGLPVHNELDVAVDFTAPDHAGRYISYWRMASPSGQKFGQRVWVLIQVDESLDNLVCNSLLGLNLNLPPDNSGVTSLEMVNLNVEPMVEVDSLPELDNSGRTTDLVEPIVETRLNKDQELNFPLNDALLVGGGVSSPPIPEVPTKVSYPIIDFSEVPPIVPSHMPSSSTHVPASAPAASENNDVEQTLLRELEGMGFKQVDLNKDILRRNDYDLVQSVDDLCGVTEWDPILEQLHEMGFRDHRMNKWLLKKNDGSIKRVVMDLVAGEKM